jgi:hypothetical protein
LVIGALLAALVLAAPANGQERARFDTQLFAHVPAPGFPAHAYVHPDGRVYTGTYVNPRGDDSPSKVFEYTGSGTLLRSWTLTGQALSEDHGVQVATSDARGRLVLLDHTPAPTAASTSPTTSSRSSGASRRAAARRSRG